MVFAAWMKLAILSPSIASELGAHRLHCPECRRALALLEVSGHLLVSDRDPVALEQGFTHRLLACMAAKPPPVVQRIRRWLYVGGPLAAAALIALAFLGVFDRRGVTKVAGLRVEPQTIKLPSPESIATGEELTPGTSNTIGADEQALEAWFDRMGTTLQNKRDSGESLQQALDLTVLQLLDILEKGQHAPAHENPIPEANPSNPPPGERIDPASSDGVEDL